MILWHGLIEERQWHESSSSALVSPDTPPRYTCADGYPAHTKSS
ncbi:MAG: hypothetical protein ACLP75_22890 [Mycobacterium sp.]